MKEMFIKILLFIKKLFSHGNFDVVNSDFDLLTKSGEMSIVETMEEEITIKNRDITQTPTIDNIGRSDEDEDESTKKIKQTLKLIKEFEEKVNKLRNINFVKSD